MPHIKCGCPPDGPAAKFQDKRYGAGWRVANPVDKTSPLKGRCTCCGKEGPLPKNSP